MASWNLVPRLIRPSSIEPPRARTAPDLGTTRFERRFENRLYSTDALNQGRHGAFAEAAL
jgi:hypothetical protein